MSRVGAERAPSKVRRSGRIARIFSASASKTKAAGLCIALCKSFCVLEKYAVRCGGGTNHRMGLGDAALVKDNHVAAAGGVAEAVAAVRAHSPDVPLEVEVDSLDQLAEALAAGVSLVLLDNFTPDQARQAVALVRAHGGGVRTEASGGLDLLTARAMAEAGVDFVAVGALTHSAPVLDIGLDALDVTG